VDPFAIYFKVLAIVGIGIVVLTSATFMRGRTRYGGEFYGLLLCVALAMSLTVAANNLVMVYLGMEFLSITSYILAGFLREDRKSGEAAIKYFLYGAVASGVMLYGISLLYGATGTTDLAGVAEVLHGVGDLSLLGFVAVALLAVGFGFKASLVPFHQWAPDTYEGAPTPVTAFLATASKATGFAVLIRVFLSALPDLQVDWVALMAGISMATMTVGNLLAIKQTNIKRMLAYSSIAQAGYILIGVAAIAMDVRSPITGINGVLLYLFAYLFTNLGAFAIVIAVEERTGSVEIADYAGLIQRAPVLAALMLVFLLSLAGIPPTGGFVGKFFVFGAAVQLQFWALAAVALVNSVVAAFYYLNVVRYMFFVPAKTEATIPVSRFMSAALMITATMTLLIGILPQTFVNWATESVNMLSMR
ncbi:MAG TPA: NADH-quinone oxidoreductase subunit N, partial [Anaerolineae bacterium]|nr:NADH-quinone oxidoreductase subunit N [Anaerolineae bacterium]